MIGGSLGPKDIALPSEEVVHSIVTSIIFIVKCKVDVLDLAYDLKCTLIFDWCIVGCESKNGHPTQKRVEM
jgi:hypothetical protein